ncbi:hypothetical protein DAPPUDRAFT_301849 [Daphnia pulex]|uniref:Uncharacterized protein n=1 Tax=Daphnia pulex TaxID=6669 RepID=E9GAN7_DAPPU|nr:hypothetical protein DAPPUDRAFT_301849 [Daphnia pulex]|eukprot:EFX83507.1 hypothetical protein DAPPUDRAFT_301849 [Daphnia pulex]
MSKHNWLKLTVSIVILVAVMGPTSKLFSFLHGEDPSPSVSGARKMEEKAVEIKPGAKYERHRRQINNNYESDELDEYFSDGCSKSDYIAAIEHELEEFLSKHEENKLQYVKDAYEKYLLRNKEPQKNPPAQLVKQGATKIAQLRKTVTETKDNLIAQLKEQWINGNATVEETKKLLRETRDNIANSDSEKKELLEQIKANNAKITRMKTEYNTIKSQKETAQMIEASKNSEAAACEAPFSYLGAFDSPNILRVKKQQLDTEESTINDIWQKKNDLKNCCQQAGCL